MKVIAHASNVLLVDTNPIETIFLYMRTKKLAPWIVSMSALNFFFVNNADDDVIQDFLWMDSCAIISDKVNVKTPLQCTSWRKEMMMLLSFDYFFFSCSICWPWFTHTSGGQN